MGTEPEPDAIDLWLEELALNPWARGLEWSREPTQRREDFSVTIIGAGMGGLNAAIQLKRAGIPFSVVEKNSGVGGTWYENRYPGARVDTPSRLYTHVFGVDYSYAYPFCPWTENRKCFDWVADTFGVRGDITFETEVRSLAWDEAASMWDITVDGREGRRTLRSNAVITAVGFLNRPNMPEIPGMERFHGPSWHSAHWPAEFDPKGKRVAVIGTGCTGYQMVPELALEAGHVTVFQRTPQWLFGAPGYRSPFPSQVPWLDRNLPYHTNFMRLRIASGFIAGFGPLAQVDPHFQDEHATSRINKVARDNCIAFLKEKLGDPDLVEKMTPEHPVLSARPVLVDPEYSILDAIQRDTVTLVTDGIRGITEAGVETEDGKLHEVDAIVYATGFKATEYLFPMSITGRGGRTVEELWSQTGAQGYLGAMIPGCPNLWTLYGPNSREPGWRSRSWRTGRTPAGVGREIRAALLGRCDVHAPPASRRPGSMERRRHRRFCVCWRRRWSGGVRPETCERPQGATTSGDTSPSCESPRADRPIADRERTATWLDDDVGCHPPPARRCERGRRVPTGVDDIPETPAPRWSASPRASD